MIGAHRTSLGDVLIYAGLIVFTLSVLYPVFYVVSVSFASIQEVARRGLFLIPQEPTLGAYRYAFSQAGVGNAYLVTIARTALGVLVNLTLTALGAYVLSRKELPLRNAMMTFVIISMLFQGGLIPLFLVVRSIGLYNTLWAMILPSAVNTFYLILLRNFFRAVPNSLIDSARIDGAGELQIMVRIIFPLSTAAFATIGLFYAVYHWNEFFLALIFVSKASLMPLQVLIRRMYMGGSDTLYMLDNQLPPPTESMRAATIVIATVPILLVYPFLQKYFVKGVMVGSVKG